MPAVLEREGDGRRLVVTGGAGFVGANLACGFRDRYPALSVVCLDNLKRRGAELSLPRLREAGVEFVHGDIRNPSDLAALGHFDALIECSAEPSVLAGYGAQRGYVLEANLFGAVHCLEAALRQDADVVFLSTSRVYPIERLAELAWDEAETRYRLTDSQVVPGASSRGIAVDFPIGGARSFYGATKLCAELLIAEYVDACGLRAVVNRCGVVSGPWQMGRVDQGVAAWWLLRHHFGGTLRYIGFAGSGKQVRDFMHWEDLLDLVEIELSDMERVKGRTFHAGGGLENSASLIELTELAQKVTGRSVPVEREKQTRPGDVRIFVTDNAATTNELGWRPRRSLQQTLEETYAWITSHAGALQSALEL